MENILDYLDWRGDLTLAERGHTIRLGRTAAETQPFFSVS